MSLTKKICLATTALAAVFAVPPAARAQEINYGALTAMFGEPVTTSATGSPQKASQVPANMEIITADQIRRSGATNIPEILRYVAGIDVRTEGITDNDVSIRGYAQPFNPRLLVLINGRQVYLDDFGYTAWNTLPVQMADIRQIEIVRGPASALFGFNAASGVINIITYDPLFDKINTLTMGLGTQGTYMGSLVSTLNKPGKGGISVQLGGLVTQEASEVGLLGGQPPGSSRPYYASYAVDARFKPTDTTEVTLEATKSDAYGDTLGPTFDYVYQGNRISSYKGSVAADTRLGLITFMSYINLAKISYLSPNGGITYDNNQIIVVQLNDLFKPADSQAIRAGFEYRNNRDSGSIVVSTLYYNDFAASLMWNWQIDQSLSFTAAGRLDHLAMQRNDPLSSADPFTLAEYNSDTITTPSYNLGLVWQPTDNDTFRLLTGRAVQAPSLFDFGTDSQIPQGPVTTLIAGNPALKPTTSTNYEIDYDRQLPAISSVLRTAVFYNVSQDFLEASGSTPFVYSNGVFASYAANVGSGQALGGEIGIQGSSDSGLRWNASYSLVGVRNKSEFAPSAAPTSFNNATPTSEINVGGGYSWHKWEADAELHWQSNYQSYYSVISTSGLAYTPVTVNNYITASARIAYNVNAHITLAATGQQLTQAKMNAPGVLQPQRTLLFTATFTE